MMLADQVLELIQMEHATPLKNALPKAVQRRVTALLALEFAVFLRFLGHLALSEKIVLTS